MLVDNVEIERELQAFEQLFEVELPTAYRVFQRAGCAPFAGRTLPFAAPDSPVEFLVTFYPADVLATQMGTYGLRIPFDLVPIGSCPSGNVVCLSVSGEFSGQVFFWDASNELPTKIDRVTGQLIPIEDASEYRDNVHFVSGSFESFCEQLTINSQIE